MTCMLEHMKHSRALRIYMKSIARQLPRILGKDKHADSQKALWLEKIEIWTRSSRTQAAKTALVVVKNLEYNRSAAFYCTCDWKGSMNAFLVNSSIGESA